MKGQLSYRFVVLLRIIAAIIGGYFLTIYLSIALSLFLPLSKAEGVVVGLLSSFVIYTSAVLWVFVARTVLKACLGLLIPGLLSFFVLTFFVPTFLL